MYISWLKLSALLCETEGLKSLLTSYYSTFFPSIKLIWLFCCHIGSFSLGYNCSCSQQHCGDAPEKVTSPPGANLSKQPNTQNVAELPALQPLFWSHQISMHQSANTAAVKFKYKYRYNERRTPIPGKCFSCGDTWQGLKGRAAENAVRLRSFSAREFEQNCVTFLWSYKI